MKIYQNDFQNQDITRYGCYMLSLIDCAGTETGLNYSIKDIEQLYYIFLKDNIIAKNCYVLRADLIMKYMTGKKWSIEKSKIIKDCDYVIANVKTKYNTFHFVRIDKNKNILYDSDRLIEGSEYQYIDYRLIRKI